MVNSSVQKISSEEKITRMVYHDVTNITSQRLIEIPGKLSGWEDYGENISKPFHHELTFYIFLLESLSNH